MNAIFRQHVEQLDPLLRQLLDSVPYKMSELPRHVPARGVYLLSENGEHLYVGRSNTLRKRLQAHMTRSRHKAAFAFRLAREASGFTEASYTRAGSRDELMKDDTFVAAFEAARNRIRAMQVRFVEERDPTRQALLEIYVATALQTRYNCFDNH